MQGPGTVVGLLVSRLTTRMPPQMATLRRQRGLHAIDLPDPVVYGDWPPLSVGIDLMPSLWVTEIQSSQIVGPYREHPSGNVSTWMFRYQLAIDCYLRDTTPGRVAEQRRLNVLACRRCLLQTPGLANTDQHGLAPFEESYGATIRLNSFQERYSNVGQINGHIVAGYTISLEVDAQEELGPDIPPVGVVDYTSASVTPIPIDLAVPLP